MTFQLPAGAGQGSNTAVQTPGQNILVTQTNPMAMGGGQLSAASTGPQPQVVQQQQQQANNPGPAGVPVRGAAPGAPVDLKHLEAQRQQNLMTIKQLQQNLEAAQQKDLHLKALIFNLNHIFYAFLKNLLLVSD